MRERPWDRPPRLELLPLIDVMFLLLVVFVFSVLSMVRSWVLPVELPSIATGETDAPTSVLVVSVDARGGMFVAGESVDLPEIERRIAELRGASPDLAVLVNADARARHGDVVRLLDRVRAAGQHRVWVVGEPGSDGAPL